MRHSYECVYRSENSKSPGARSQISNDRELSPSLPAFPTISASTLVDTSQPTFHRQWSTEDLELLHFYTTSTSLTFSTVPERRHVWQNTVPQIAFSHDAGFLLHGLLAISALHLSRLAPERKAILYTSASTHHAAALPLFRSALSSINSQNCHACSAFAALLAVYKWASVNDSNSLFFANTDDHVEADTVEWVQLLRGAGSIIYCYYQDITQGPLRPISHWDNASEISAAANPEDAVKFAALEQLWDSAPVPISATEIEALKETLRWLKITYTMISRPNESSDAAADALSWPVRVPDLFLLMVNRRQPEALVLLAHYCLLLNKVEDFWWIRGMSRHLLQKIHLTLGKEWESWLCWPLQDLVLCEFRNHHPENTGSPLVPTGP